MACIMGVEVRGWCGVGSGEWWGAVGGGGGGGVGSGGETILRLYYTFPLRRSILTAGVPGSALFIRLNPDVREISVI